MIDIIIYLSWVAVKCEYSLGTKDGLIGLTIEQALQRDVAPHKEGRLEESDCLYRNIFYCQPLNPDANDSLGVLAVLVSVHKANVALPFLNTAL